MQRYAADVSARGMFLRTGRQLPLGARVRFELVLQSGRCALGGVGRVAWLRAAEPALGRVAGAGLAFERLRRGDRAVIERMDAARAGALSRFDQPDEGTDDPGVEPPQGAQLAKLLFEDLGARSESEPAVSAFLSADLSSELGNGGWRYGSRSGSAEVVADLAEQLEPGAEPSEQRADQNDEQNDAPQRGRGELEVELGRAPASEPPVAHSTVRPAPMPIAAVSLTTSAVAEAARGTKPAGAPALRARIQALRAAETAAPANEPVASVSPATAVPAAVLSSELVAPLDGTPAEALSAEPALMAAPGLTPAPHAAPLAGSEVSAAALENAGVSVALARAAVQLAAAPDRTSSAVAGVPRTKAKRRLPTLHRALVPERALPVVAGAPEPAASEAVVVARRTSTWPLAIALSLVIVGSSAVTYLALSDQLPRVLALLGLG